MKKLLSVLVVAGFLASLGCGGETGTKDKDKKPATGGAGTTPPKDKDKKDKGGD